MSNILYIGNTDIQHNQLIQLLIDQKIKRSATAVFKQMESLPMTIFLDISQWPFYKNTMTPFNVLHAAFLLEKKKSVKNPKTLSMSRLQ